LLKNTEPGLARSVSRRTRQSGERPSTSNFGINTENGFCVLRVKARGHRDLVTVVGHAATITAGELVQASGVWFKDRTHGQQLKASLLKSIAPTTLEGVEKYLSSGMIRGIGPVYAKRLVKAFGEAV
jgi:exodeoxyribonuclease V alpha subunit